MKITKILISFILLGFFLISNAGSPIPKGCELEGYEKNKYCPSYYTIGKVKTNINNLTLTEKELLKLDFPILEVEEGDYYILGNNYFYSDGLKNIKESFFVGEGWINIGKINKGDVVIIDNLITGYENNDSRLIDIESAKYIKNKIGFDGKLKLVSSYGNYYKVICKNDIISLSNEDKKYNLGFKNYEISDKEIGNKEKVRNNLQDYIKTCDNFNKLFDLEYNYKNNTDYKLKLNKYKRSLNKRFGKVLSKITGYKLTKLFNKIEEVRKEKNNDKNLIQEEKDNINILLDALIEILK